ncbi:MAG: flagellar basal body-associated FliL family protein [Thermotogae bacterium]|nr:flagellar basal body-associated FliL family protein [Thermotogota bacterium]
MDKSNERGASLVGLLIVAVVAAIVGALTGFMVMKMLGTNKKKPEVPQISTVIKAVIVPEGKLKTYMLKGGREVIALDGLSFKVGSIAARTGIANHQDEINDAIQTLFLRKEVDELSTVAGLQLLKQQIKDLSNAIIGYTGDKAKYGVQQVYISIKSFASVE